MNDLQDYDFDYNENDWRFEGNPYYSPELCGLRIVAEIEFSEPSYSFDTQVVWFARNGNLYTAHDSGCSCPSPFEDFHKLSQLTLVDKSVLDNLKTEMLSNTYISATMGQEFFEKIRDAVRKGGNG